MAESEATEQSEITEQAEPIQEDQEEAGAETETKAKRKFSKKDKKLIRRRPSKKEKESGLSTAIRLTIESGKVEFGTRRGVSHSALSKPLLFVLAGNTMESTKEELRKYCSISGVPILDFTGNSIELGSVCGKPFPVSVLTVHEVGSSTLLDFVSKKK